nr:PREDICTED: uncharacterized protein LOC109033121 [Bemisia tabaci]
MTRYALIALVMLSCHRASVDGDETSRVRVRLQNEGSENHYSNQEENSVVKDQGKWAILGVDHEEGTGQNLVARGTSSDGKETRNWTDRIPTGGFFITSPKKCQNRCSRIFGYWEDPAEENLLNQPKIASVGKIYFGVKCSCFVDKRLKSLITERYGPNTAKYYTWLCRFRLFGLKYRKYFNKGDKAITFVGSSELKDYIKRKQDEWTKMREAQETLAALPDYSNTRRK